MSGYHLFGGDGACPTIVGGGIAWALFGGLPWGEVLWWAVIQPGSKVVSGEFANIPIARAARNRAVPESLLCYSPRDDGASVPI